MSKESAIHFEFYRHLQNVIDGKEDYYGVRYSKAVPEKKVNSGRADVVIYDDRDRPFIVVEAKRESPTGYDRNLDPYSPKVIKQAAEYAFMLGSSYFATYNGRYLVLFNTYEMGVPLLSRKTRAYQIKDIKTFSREFLEQVAALKTRKIGWEPDPRAFVKRLKVFHERLANELYISVEGMDEGFKNRLNDWVEKQGWDLEEEESYTRFSNQAAYLLMNKLLFYKILEDTGHNVPKLTLPKLVNPSARAEAFKKIIDTVDFEAVYEHDPIYDEIPLTNRASFEVEEFLQELEKYQLDRFKHDTIGHIYEEIIPPKERHDLGQYYTPPEIVELITKLTLKNPDDKILDPACGSGTFLITSYNRLEKLKTDSKVLTSHEEILDQLFGIDINRFPAHLTAINLALQDLKSETREINIEIEDFFHINPSQDRFYAEKVGIDKSAELVEKSDVTVPSKVDVVLANPPYIRQEKIKDKDLARNHLSSISYEKMSERSDIYVYFFTHSYQFLNENGRLGFITSDKWLSVDYGEDLQNFFLDNFKINAIISFNRRIFETPLVPTCVTILEKCDDKEVRKNNLVKFVRVKSNISIDNLIKLIEESHNEDEIKNSEEYKIILKKQYELRTAEKWNIFIFAPPIYWQILSSKKIGKLDDVANISRGVTTGANDFFHINDDEIDSFDIKSDFLTKTIKSIRDIKGIVFKPGYSDLYLLDIHDFVKKVLGSGELLENEIKKEVRNSENNFREKQEKTPRRLTEEEVYVTGMLKKKGYNGLYKYILWGTEKGYYNRRTCSQRKIWFDLGKLHQSKIISPKFIWEDAPYLWLEKPLPHQHALGYVDPYNDENKKIIAGYLNSDVCKFFQEFHGRTEGGRALQILVYERRNLPCIDPKQLTQNEKKKIEEAFTKLIENENKVSEDKLLQIRNELNEAILKPLNLEEYAEEIYKYSRALAESRIEGKEVDIMIEGIQSTRFKVKKIKGATILEDRQRKLTDYKPSKEKSNNHQSKYDPILDDFLDMDEDLVKVQVEDKEANYLRSQLKKRIDIRELGDKVNASVVNGVCYLEKIE